MKEHIVKVADLAAEKGDVTLITLGLGSCVAVALWDPAARVGGLAHVLLPSRTLARDQSNPAKFPETAVPLLIERIAALGGSPHRLTARLVGGAAMFANISSSSVAQMGERNVIAMREALKTARVPVMAEDTGKDYGRSVYLSVATGRLEVRSVQHGVREL
jgi:chemotaxis protein CheD